MLELIKMVAKIIGCYSVLVYWSFSASFTHL